MRLKPHLLMLCLLAGINVLNGQNTYYVTPNGAGSMDGTGWGDAYNSVIFRNVLKTATNGSIFWLASGIYTPGNDRDSSFFIPSGVKVYGGFPANGNPIFSDRDYITNLTVLSGEIGTPALMDNCYHVVQFKYTDSTTILDGLIISDGYASGTNEKANGAGIYNDGTFSSLVGSNPTIVNCTIKNNHANNNGAGMYTKTQGGKGNPIISHCSFIGNDAGNGGAIHNDGMQGSCSAVVSGCRFIRNKANIGSAIYNAGNYTGSNYSSFTNCLFIKNSATLKATYYCDGQNASSSGCITTLKNCTFVSDSAFPGNASVIYNYTYNGGICITNVMNCILWGNTMPNIFNYASGGGTTTNISYSDIEGGYVGTNNIAAYPMFFDETNEDYRIASCSPCVNAGTSLGAPNMDIDSSVRPIKGAYDMGVYESKDTGIIAATIAVSVSPNDTFCANTSVTVLSNSNVPSPSYRWQVNGVTSGTNSPYFTSSALANGDVVSCKVTSSASCLSPNNAIDSVSVNVLPLAHANFNYTNTGLSYNFDTANCNGSSFKWFFGDGDSSSVPNPVHSYTSGANYIVILVAYNGCGSDTFRQNLSASTGVQMIGERSIDIYPNPTKGTLLISVSGFHPESISVYDVKGQKVSEQGFTPTIDVTALADGIYYIEVKEVGVIRKKFAKLQ